MDDKIAWILVLTNFCWMVALIVSINVLGPQ